MNSGEGGWKEKEKTRSNCWPRPIQWPSRWVREGDRVRGDEESVVCTGGNMARIKGRVVGCEGKEREGKKNH